MVPPLKISVVGNTK